MAVFTALAALATVVGTVKSVQAQRSASRAQQKQTSLENRRSRMQAVRQAQIQRAGLIASAGGAGAADSSGQFGGAGALRSQAASAIGFASQQSGLSNIITRQNERASFWSGVAGIGANVFNSTGGFDALFPQRPTNVGDFTQNPNFAGPR